jgi:protein-S-isoprenylcysteine O-methyltransferase Ste14
MNTARYVIAVLALVGTPPGVGLWFVIHPFARHWRRLGAGWTYTILTPPTLAIMYGLWALRHPLVGTDLGTNVATIAVAVVLLVATIIISANRRKVLTTSILVGVAELSESRYPGTLLTEGIYARIRHPRYVEVTLAVAAYVLFANYVGTYVLLLASIGALYLVVLLEERELIERFGDAYVQYAARVPRFVPRWSRRPTPE